MRENDSDSYAFAPDSEVVRKQYELSKPLYAKRAEAVAKIPNFWPLVLEQAPPEIDQYVKDQDSRILMDHVTGITVRRPELEEKGAAGHPRSVSIKFDFSPNEEFSDTSLEKTFWYRRATDGWTGLVSEPVKIHWKKGKDLTEGLTDAAVALWEARKKAGDMTAKDLPAYTALERKVEHWNGANTSFFTWFGFVSARRWVSPEESEAATKEYRQKKESRKQGEVSGAAEAAENQDEDESQDDQAVEVHEAGDDLAVSFADDLWPGAVRYFTQAQEMGDVSDPEFEDEDDDDDESDEDGPVDIRSLVQGKGNSHSNENGGPPRKKTKR